MSRTLTKHFNFAAPNSEDPRGCVANYVRIGRLGFSLLLLLFAVIFNDRAARAQSAPNQTSAANTARVFRDPVTGRTYRQELKSVNVPKTEWRNQPKTQTVYERQVTTRYVPAPQVVYAPVQTYALTPTVRGWWNPFRSPYYSYRYQPITAWQPTVQNQTVPVSTEKWVPKQQTVYVPEPVQTTEVQQQLVTTEIPSNGQVPTTLYANQPAPRLRIPLLARQQVFPPRSAPTQTVPLTAASSSLASTTLSTERLRPVGSSTATASLATRGYNAPLRTAAAPPSLSRDTGQTGMSATVLR